MKLNGDTDMFLKSALVQSASIRPLPSSFRLVTTQNGTISYADLCGSAKVCQVYKKVRRQSFKNFCYSLICLK
jgi:hypothetical protein